MKLSRKNSFFKPIIFTKLNIGQSTLELIGLSSILNPGCGNALDKLPLTKKKHHHDR
jgi:hypothetical protein